MRKRAGRIGGRTKATISWIHGFIEMCDEIQLCFGFYFYSRRYITVALNLGLMGPIETKGGEGLKLKQSNKYDETDSVIPNSEH